MKPFEAPDVPRKKMESDKTYVKRLIDLDIGSSDYIDEIRIDKDISIPIIVYGECRECYAQYAFALDSNRYYSWYGGRTLIQDAMPGIKPEDREILKSQICGKCWSKMFGLPPRGRR